MIKKKHAIFSENFSQANINLKREVAINTREGIVSNYYYLNSFSCYPQEIRKFVFSFMLCLGGENLDERKKKRKEADNTINSLVFVESFQGWPTSENFTSRENLARIEFWYESQVSVDCLSKINFMQNWSLYCDPKK